MQLWFGHFHVTVYTNRYTHLHTQLKHVCVLLLLGLHDNGLNPKVLTCQTDISLQFSLSILFLRQYNMTKSIKYRVSFYHGFGTKC